MPLNEADTRAKLIDPALHAKGWSEDLIRRETTAGAVEIVGGSPRRALGRADYTLRVQVAPETQPVAVALIEAKSERRLPWRTAAARRSWRSARRGRLRTPDS